MRQYKQLELFKHRLPKKPHCGNYLKFGLTIREAQQAIKRKYIQPNKPWCLAWMPNDVDRDGAAHDWKWIDSCPAPNIVVENRENGHAHLFYGLEIPVSTYDRNGTKAARYAAAVQFALMKKLRADPGYTAYTAKNPLHDFWQVTVHQQYLYSLDWLADYLDLETFDARKRAPDYGIGRNCTLFSIVRKYAYKAVKDYWNDRRNGKAAFYDDLQIKAYQTNIIEFSDNGLYRQEIDHVIKSVCNWTWRNFTPEDFAEIQKARSQKAADKRQAAANKKRQRLLGFMNDQPEASNRELSRLSGYPRSTVQRLKKAPLKYLS